MGRLLAGCSAVVLVGASLAATAGAAVAGPARIGSAPRLPRGARVLGALPAATVMHVEVALEPRDPAGLEAFAAAVSTPTSARYRQFLAKGAFASRFGPTTAAIATVEASLRSAGLEPGPISANHLSIPVTATAGVLGKAFSTGLETVQIGARTAYVNTSAPLFSGAAAADVQGVIGLDDLTVEHPDLVAARHPAHRTAAAPAASSSCPAAVSAASADGGYTSAALAGAYGFTSLYGAGDTGAGIKIGVYELEPFTASDISEFQSCYGTNATVDQIGSSSDSQSGEAALDIEDAISFAPGATIDVYEADNTAADAYDEYATMIDDDAVQVISTSWGACEPEIGSTASAENTLFEQAAAQGQSVFAASGDQGSEDCDAYGDPDDLFVDDPSSQPFVTGVGGTYLPSSGADVPDLAAQETWDDAYGASGGGLSGNWSMPSYQSGSALDYWDEWAPDAYDYCSSTPCRESPDVSGDASPETGLVIYYTGDVGGTSFGGWNTIGGTSIATPMWAALAALVDDSPGCDGSSIGFANPTLYEAAGASYPSTFTDVTSGGNDWTGENRGRFLAQSGYDAATGLGSPLGSGLAAKICLRAPSAPASVLVHAGPGNVAGDGEVAVSWTPGADGGTAITGYVLSVSPPCASCGGMSPGAATSTTVTGLTPGTSYTVSVRATNSVGTGPAFTAAAITPATVPFPPGGLRVAAGSIATPGDGQATLSWTAPAGDGAPIAGYGVSAFPACPSCHGLGAAAGTGSSRAISGLVPGTAYTFAVSAFDSVGTGVPADTGRATVFTVPAAPTVGAPAAVTGGVQLAFRAPAVNGGQPVTGYVVTPAPACPACRGTVTTATSTTVTGLTPGVTYRFTVKAVNREGAGPPSGPTAAVGIPLPDGYWLVARDGTVFALGVAPRLSGTRTSPADPVVGITSTPDGKGIFVVTADGVVTAAGDAHFHGDLPVERVVRTDIVSIVASHDGGGYWLVGADGEVYAFGDALFHGDLLSLAKPVLVSNIVGMVGCSGDLGYLLVGSDGGVFAFGRTRFFGSLPGIHVKVRDIRAILPSADDTGYVLVGADGGAFVFGSGTRFFGSLPGRRVRVSDIVGLAITPGGGGYYMAGANGAVYGFGNARVYPTPAGLGASLPVTAIAGV